MPDSAIYVSTAQGEVKIATDLVVDPEFGPVHLFRTVSAGGAGPGGGLTDAELRAAPVVVDATPGAPAANDYLPVRLSDGAAFYVAGGGAGGGLTDTELRASPVAVSGPLTDTQLRATAVAVSGSWLTDTQLRAAAVPVSGIFWQAVQPVSGPLTDAQLRAAAVPVSGPLTDTQLRAASVPVSGAFWQATQPVSGPLTDTQLRASAVKIVESPLNKVNIALYAEAVAGIIAETAITLQKSVGFATPAGATSNGASAGKTLRILGMLLTWVATTTTANTARIRLRVNPGGAAVIGSPIAYTARIGWESATFIANECEFQPVLFPHAIDIPNPGQVMATIACVAANGTLDIQLLAHEFTP